MSFQMKTWVSKWTCNISVAEALFIHINRPVSRSQDVKIWRHQFTRIHLKTKATRTWLYSGKRKQMNTQCPRITRSHDPQASGKQLIDKWAVYFYIITNVSSANLTLEMLLTLLSILTDTKFKQHASRTQQWAKYAGVNYYFTSGHVLCQWACTVESSLPRRNQDPCLDEDRFCSADR